MNTLAPIDESQMTLGTDWAGQGVSGWYCTEKFDGVRAYWDGQTIWTRGGHALAAPASLLRQLPAIPLDCELWCGYGTLGKAKAAAQAGKFDGSEQLIVHDAPSIGADYATRMRMAARAVGNRARVKVAQVATVKGTADVHARLAKVKAKGGEGLVLRNPATIGYEIGRTANLLKVKHRIDQ